MPACSKCNKIKKYYEDKDYCYGCSWEINPDIWYEIIIPEILNRPEHYIYSSIGLLHFNTIIRKWGVRDKKLKKELLLLYVKPQIKPTHEISGYICYEQYLVMQEN